jgi:uncharacterized protein (TIGR02145 family)
MCNTKSILTQVLLFSVFSAIAEAQTVKDIDGNIYNTVVIGDQVWMAENLKTTKYNDSTDIPFISDNKDWKALFAPAYFWYDNDEKANKNSYGALYNWYAVSTNKICPAGWRIPGYEEWTTMIEKLKGGERIAGGQLKETGTTHWKSPNKRATNSIGFTALPGGFRDSNGKFHDIGIYGGWWSNTEASASKALYRGLLYDYGTVGSGESHKADGFSVRCLRDY